MAVPVVERKTAGRGQRLLARLGYTLAALLVVGLALGAARLPRFLASSAHFRLADLDVTGLRLLRGQDVLVASGLGLGDNLFAIDLESVAARLSQVPWIRQVYVERRPPARLSVAIVERRRLAWIALDAIYGIDADGVLLPGEKHPEEQRQDLDLPVITGLGVKPGEGAGFRPGMRLTDAGALRALRWWEAARQCAPAFCQNVSEIRPLADGGVRLLMIADGLEVRLPADRVPEQLGVLAALMPRLYRERPEPAYVDLRFDGQVVAGMPSREEAVAPEGHS
jgi:cell division septal protein FtsQ